MKKFFGTVILVGFALGALSYIGCEIPTEFEHDVTLDTPETGVISGYVFIPLYSR